MSQRTTYLRLFWVFLLVCGSLLALNLGGKQHKIAAAPLQNSGGAPVLKGVTLSAGQGLLLSDPLPGAPDDRTVYYDNTQAGVLTLTFEISGTAPLTLTAGGAFGYTPTHHTTTTGALAWQPVITYPVSTTAVTEAGTPYTILNVDSLSTTLWLTYVRDISAPVVTLNVPAMLTTTHQPVFVLTGTVHDGGAGVAKVEVRTEDNGGWSTAEGTQPWVYTWTLPSTNYALYTPTVRAVDRVGNAASVSRSVLVDTIPPEDPFLEITDRTSGDVDFTNEITVSINLTNDTDAAAWLLSENQETQPPGADPAWQTTEPTTFALSAPEGEKILYAWVKDHAGNINTGTVSETIFLDTHPPTVMITVPAQTATSPVPVAWTAEDPAPSSNELLYTVHYREDSGDWRIWLENTTVTASGFESATLGHTYTFKVTAQDAAGNLGVEEALLRYEAFKVFVPLLIRNWAAWYPEDLHEPNDTRDEPGANLLLEPNREYHAYIWHADDNDYYAFKSDQNSNIRVHLDLSAVGLHPNVDYDLYIYDSVTGNIIAMSNYTKVPTEETEFSAIAGRKYYIRVYPFQGYNNDVAYKLTIYK